jgi:nucleoside 2-deoxyribosyltransferase
MKKIYFAASIRGGQEDRSLYVQIIDDLQQYGHVLTEHIVAGTTSHLGSVGDVRDIRRQDLSWINESDVVVAEVTNPSLGVGYEIAYAEAAGKKIVCLYKPHENRSLSAMIAGSPLYKVHEYQTFQDIQDILKAYLI